jgi:hypothetical protein
MLLQIYFSLFLSFHQPMGCIFEDGLYRAKWLDKGKLSSQSIIVDIEGCLILRIHYPDKSIVSVESDDLDDNGHGIIQWPNGQKREVVVNIQEPVVSY